MSNSYDADQSENEIDRTTTSSMEKDSSGEFDALLTLPPVRIISPYQFIARGQCAGLIFLSLSRSLQTLDTDSDLDDFHAVIDESERQLIKARLTLERKRRRTACSPRDEHTLVSLSFDRFN